MELKDITKEAITISAESSFRDSVAMMIEQKTNSLLVVEDDGKLIGEVNVTDLLETIVPEFLEDDAIAAHFATSEMFEQAIKESADKTVRDFMQTDYRAVKNNDSLMSLAQTAIKSKKARIPVVDEEGKPTGIVSRRGIKHLVATFLGIEDTD